MNATLNGRLEREELSPQRISVFRKELPGQRGRFQLKCTSTGEVVETIEETVPGFAQSTTDL